MSSYPIYNIQLNSPQLAYNLNKKKYYLYVINKNNKIKNKPITPKYSPLYYKTGYDLIFNPNEIIIPN